MKSNLKWILAALAAIAFVVVCLGVAANGQALQQKTLRFDSPSTAMQAMDPETRFKSWTEEVAQAKDQTSPPIFFVQQSCTWCDRQAGKISFDITVLREFPLPGVYGDWQLIRPGKEYRQDETSRTTYGYINAGPYRGVISYVPPFANYKAAVTIPLSDDTDTPAGEYQLIVRFGRLLDGQPLQQAILRFWVDRTDNQGRLGELAYYAVPQADGGATIKGRFVAGAEYWVLYMDSGGSGTISSGFLCDPTTLCFGGRSAAEYERAARIVIVSPSSGAHMTVPETFIQKYRSGTR